MLWQQQQQQQPRGELSQAPVQQQGSRVEVARPQIFSGRMEDVSTFINVAHIYIRMKMTEEVATT